jgi:hypothetical protein
MFHVYGSKMEIIAILSDCRWTYSDVFEVYYLVNILIHMTYMEVNKELV